MTYGLQTKQALFADRAFAAWRAGLRPFGQLRHSRIAIVGLAIVVFWVVVALTAPWIAPYPPNATDPSAASNPLPSAAHWLGTDFLGRDLLSRIIWGTRPVLVIAPLAVLGATALGIVLGLIAGYYRGIVDLMIVRTCDILLAFPVLILYMIVFATIGASALNIIIVIAVTKFPIIARLARALTLELKEREYIAAAKMRNETTSFILFVEILPNVKGPVIVEMCLRLGYSTITIGALGFLGIGLPPPAPDWGGMVKEAYGVISIWPHMALVPCVAISSLVIGFNLLAAGLRELGLKD